MAKRPKAPARTPALPTNYGQLVSGITALLEQARRATARAVNSILTATYWEVGRRIVDFEQGGQDRAGYGEALLPRLAQDLTKRHGRGFSRQGLQIDAHVLPRLGNLPDTVGQMASSREGIAQPGQHWFLEHRGARPSPARCLPAPLVPLRSLDGSAELSGPTAGTCTKGLRGGLSNGACQGGYAGR